MKRLKSMMQRYTRSQIKRAMKEVFEDQYPMDEATTFLKRYLADGPKQFAHILKTSNLSERTLRRAAEEIGIKRKQTGYGRHKRSWWSLR